MSSTSVSQNEFSPSQQDLARSVRYWKEGAKYVGLNDGSIVFMKLARGHIYDVEGKVVSMSDTSLDFGEWQQLRNQLLVNK